MSVSENDIRKKSFFIPLYEVTFLSDKHSQVSYLSYTSQLHCDKNDSLVIARAVISHN